MDSWIEIDSKALRHNYNLFCSLVKSTTIIAPVIKSNAYGHGFDEIFNCLAPLNPSWICVNYISEGVRLREIGFEGNVLVVGPISSDSLDLAYDRKIDLTISNDFVLNDWLATKNKYHIHIKFDTGLSRQGFDINKVEKIYDSLYPFSNLIRGIFSHFANIEDTNTDQYAIYQLNNFKKVYSYFEKKKLKFIKHISSSASTLVLNQSHHDMCRIGFSLYGQWPSDLIRCQFILSSKKRLKKVLSFKTKVKDIKIIDKNKYIGYGCSFKTNKKTKIAILPIGYNEGLPRQVANAPSYVLIKGSRCYILGRISMNMTVVDISHLDIQYQETAVIIGKSQNETIEASDIANWSKTIPYEILTKLNQNIKKIIV